MPKIIIVSANPKTAVQQSKEILVGVEAKLSGRATAANELVTFHTAEANRQRGVRNTNARQASKIKKAINHLFGM
ncbi:MAG: hypothetical protein VE99_C0003G0018 [candidate division Kazan bacterium GW2011_GWC1_52_13]|uniref:Uncharacterized protein n=1 Tax=candidate division Kazan bacterium GW2011_GWB1_52_7 TaxID=1620414 RepID=A0A0G2A293_UNCK3|nr:MAG: hypothetical protein VE99_C0003G0018 [candidate division Kazan bacterium GW2011_GWC1_52_13]KKW26274.1 MAG: hypothetical protein VF00_C0013G0011 [candidate division Kazan bacterium GW2011_GWB1_52_7]